MRLIALCLSFFLISVTPVPAYHIKLTPEEINWIGEKIFANECSSRNDLLVQWNDGEDFLSLGIGHFIWYPKGEKGFFIETFPDFLTFAKISGADIPGWLSRDLNQPCPWQTKKEFLQNIETGRVKQLRSFLENTKSLQTRFIIARFEGSIPVILSTVSDAKEKQKIENRIEMLLSTPQGTYALIDYANFKGLGISPKEGYKGEGWGLLQVLSGMKDEEMAPDAVKEFSRSADRVLTRRVDNSPKSRNEQQWLAGWRNRVKTYLKTPGTVLEHE